MAPPLFLFSSFLQNEDVGTSSLTHDTNHYNLLNKLYAKGIAKLIQPAVMNNCWLQAWIDKTMCISTHYKHVATFRLLTWWGRKSGVEIRRNGILEK